MKRAPSEENPNWYHILRTATQLFANEDPVNVTMRRVAKEANVALGTLLHYFPSRDDLEKACFKEIQKSGSELGEEIIAAFAAGAPPAELIDKAVRQGFFMARQFKGCGIRRRRRLLAGEAVDIYAEDQDHVQVLEAISQFIVMHGGERRKARLTIELILQSVTRFAFSPTEELRVWLGEDGLTDDEVIEATLDFLVESCQDLFQKAAPRLDIFPAKRAS